MELVLMWRWRFARWVGADGGVGSLCSSVALDGAGWGAEVARMQLVSGGRWGLGRSGAAMAELRAH